MLGLKIMFEYFYYSFDEGLIIFILQIHRETKKKRARKIKKIIEKALEDIIESYSVLFHSNQRVIFF